MTLNAGSYGDIAGVVALTRHLLDGSPTFSILTRPTLEDVEGFVNRWSATLDVALTARGVILPILNPMILAACDQWIIRQAAAEVELTQRGVGFSDVDDSRSPALRPDNLDSFADSVAGALRQLGVIPTESTSSGLSYTGTAVAIFTRGQFDS